MPQFFHNLKVEVRNNMGWLGFELYVFFKSNVVKGGKLKIKNYYLDDDNNVKTDILDDPTVALPKRFGVLPKEQVQELFDSLWHAGIRPSEHHSQGEIDALKDHLGDMRKIAFNKLNIKESS